MIQQNFIHTGKGYKTQKQYESMLEVLTDIPNNPLTFLCTWPELPPIASLL
jgi:hypothetical protein